jgi:16S rRNA (guanine527-N7)-methyltransferase
LSGALPDLTREAFERALRSSAIPILTEEALAQLFVHYSELARWNRSLSLIGPGTLGDPIARHYAESLAGLTFLDPQDRIVVDVGSGAGFPGWVIAAARPELEVTLVESRQRKWSFLSQTSQKAALPCHCLNARVTSALPEGFPTQVDLVLMRAVRLGEKELSALVSGLSRRGRFLLWSGDNAPFEVPGLVEGRSEAILGSRSRRIVEWVQKSRRRQAL